MQIAQASALSRAWWYEWLECLGKQESKSRTSLLVSVTKPKINVADACKRWALFRDATTCT